MKKVLFYLCFTFIWLFSLLPLSVLYVFSDCSFFIIYYIIRYRRGVVRENLSNSFPEKSIRDIIKIEKQFYHSFCDIFIEALKLLHISEEEIAKRMKIVNNELVNKLMDNGQNVFVLLGHYGNWEWNASLALLIDKKYVIAQIYHPLRDPLWDKFFDNLRSRFGAINIPMKKTFREIISHKRQGKIMAIGFISDQSPKKEGLDFWTTFLNQDTAFLTGAERIAKQTNSALVYSDVRKIKRGYYESTLVLMTDRPNEMPDYEITEMYARMMEKTIQRDPAYWLWTHKRWKHKHEVNSAQ